MKPTLSVLLKEKALVKAIAGINNFDVGRVALLAEAVEG